jgi:hypothetical protein
MEPMNKNTRSTGHVMSPDVARVVAAQQERRRLQAITSMHRVARGSGVIR